jgi:hypothetical protein
MRKAYTVALVRLATALAVIAVAWAAALYVHQRRVTVHVPARGNPKPSCVGSCYEPGAIVLGYTGGTPASSYVTHPSWEDPAAVLLALGGVAVAVGIVSYRR